MTTQPQRRARAFFLWAAASLWLAPTASTTQTPTTHAFDVVSIRPNNDPKNWHLQTTPDGYNVIGMPLGMTVSTAFLTTGRRSRDWVVNAPDWLWSEPYDFVGKVTPEDQAAWNESRSRSTFLVPDPSFTAMLQQMLQSALADRCKLIAHLVPAKTDGYALMLARKTPKRKALKESTPGEPIPSTALHIGNGGSMIPIMSNEDPVLTFYQTNMSTLAAMLPLGRSVPVIDMTGLTGGYDFKLFRLTNDDEVGGKWDLAALGLKLVPIKVPIQKIVIDHIERPTPN